MEHSISFTDEEIKELYNLVSNHTRYIMNRDLTSREMILFHLWSKINPVWKDLD